MVNLDVAVNEQSVEEGESFQSVESPVETLSPDESVKSKVRAE